ncbi:MAG: DHH family phosphoesterase [Oscillospiraceae bacterium]|nr:DHH family phosphoesterase [Oscillospiraceae bacterium]
MDKTVKWLKKHDNYLILTHTLPDGDAIGSAAALCAGLRLLGKRAFVAGNPGIIKRYVPYVKDYLAPEGYVYENAIAVDSASRARIPKEWENTQLGLSIDHHTGYIPFAEVNLLDEEAAACGEIIYHLLLSLDIILTKEIALLLYVALSTDTGCYRYANTTARTHEITAALMRTGIDINPVNWVMFEQKSRARLQLEAHVYADMRFYMDGALAVATVGCDFIASISADEDDLDALSSLPRKIEGVEIGVLLRETEEGVKLSIRTSQDYRADLIAAKLGGGGHRRAAGATVKLSLEQALEQIIKAVSDAQ